MTDVLLPFTAERYEDKPLIVMTGYHLGDSVIDTIHSMNQAVDGYLTEIAQPAYLIIDLTDGSINFSQIVQTMSAATRAEPGSMRDPRIIQSVMVTTNSVLEMASKAFGQNQYGQLNVPVFTSLNEALAYVEERLAAKD